MGDELITTQLNKLLRKRSFNGKEVGQLLIYSLMFNAYKCDKVDLDKVIAKYRQAYKTLDFLTGALGGMGSSYETYASLHVGLCFMVNYIFAHNYRVLYYHDQISRELKEVLANKKTLQLDNANWNCNLLNLEEWTRALKLVLAYNELLKIFEEVYELENLSICLKSFNTDFNLKLVDFYNEDVEKLINSGMYSKENILKAFKRINVKELYPTKANIKKVREHIEVLGTTQKAILEYKYYLLEYSLDLAGVKHE